MLLRFLAYGLLGWSAEILWTACCSAISGAIILGAPRSTVELRGRARFVLVGYTYLWMLPIYGLAALLFEPIHDALRPAPWALRGIVYTIGIFSVEATAGCALRALTGRCPWDYAYARTSIGGVIRIDYAPVWFLFGLLLERVHDLLLTVEGPIRASLFG